MPKSASNQVNSMTGFAAGKGNFFVWSWVWDIRSVNGKGLDIRLRLPEWIDGLEPLVRKFVGENVARGNVSVTLRVTREEGEAVSAVNVAGLEAALEQLAEVEVAARAKGLALAPTSAAQVLSMRGVVEVTQSADDTGPLRAALMEDLGPLVTAFNDMRAHEGAALADILGGQLDEVAALVAGAQVLLDARADTQAQALKTAMARVMDNVDGLEPARIEQELALIAVKTDVREELDRLTAHVAQAKTLLAASEPRGRKLDFLMQEFNREANTLCSKAGFKDLTRIGLDLKALIDQMREQVQNIE